MGALAIDTTAFAWSGDTWSAASTSVASPLTINGSVTSNTWRPVAFASTRMHPIMPRAWGVGETEAAAGSPMPCQRRTSKRRIQASCDGGPGRGVRGTTRSAGRRWRDIARHAEAVEPAHGQFGTAWRWRQRRAQRCGEGRNHRARTRPGRTRRRARDRRRSRTVVGTQPRPRRSRTASHTSNWRVQGAKHGRWGFDGGAGVDSRVGRATGPRRPRGRGRS